MKLFFFLFRRKCNLMKKDYLVCFTRFSLSLKNPLPENYVAI